LRSTNERCAPATGCATPAKGESARARARERERESIQYTLPRSRTQPQPQHQLFFSCRSTLALIYHKVVCLSLLVFFCAHLLFLPRFWHPICARSFRVFLLFSRSSPRGVNSSLRRPRRLGGTEHPGPWLGGLNGPPNPRSGTMNRKNLHHGGWGCVFPVVLFLRVCLFRPNCMSLGQYEFIRYTLSFSRISWTDRERGCIEYVLDRRHPTRTTTTAKCKAHTAHTENDAINHHKQKPARPTELAHETPFRRRDMRPVGTGLGRDVRPVCTNAFRHLCIP
jgi:hypothetical protein